jgi:triosephosphate isomerase
MKRPYISINPKSYLFGDALIELALGVDKLAEEFEIDTLFTAPYVYLAQIAQSTSHLIVAAQGADGITPGRGMGLVLPDSLKDVGVQAVILNHAERPMTVHNLAEAVRRVKELDMLSIVAVDTVEEAKMAAILEPTNIICEPTGLIGSGSTSDESYMKATLNAIHGISPKTLISQSAGVKSGDDVYRAIMNGADGTGASSGVAKAERPLDVVRSMFEGAARAKKELGL